MMLSVNSGYFVSVNKLIFVVGKFCVFYAARTELLSVFWTNFGFKGYCVYIASYFENHPISSV
jgi:hypothetical protein